MSKLINKNFHPRSIELMKAFDAGRTKLELDEYPFGTLVMYYEIALAHDLNTAAQKIEKEFELQNKPEYIVPRTMLSQFNASMLGTVFAQEVYKSGADNCGDLVARCYQYFPPSFGFMVAYLLAVSFGKADIAAIMQKLIKAHPPVAECMPYFLSLAQAPAIVERLSELQKLFSSAKTTESIKNDALEEDIEKHEELNPRLFDKNNKLKPKVREKALAVADELIRMLEEREIKLVVKDLIITGSNASYNYTKDSDVDLHLVADTSGLEDPDGLYPIIYQAIKSAFNNKYDIEFYGIPVEVYIESTDTPLVSNGIYSVLNDYWVKEPVAVEIPEVDIEALQKIIKPWEERYQSLVSEIESGKITTEAEIDSFINDLYAERDKGLKIGEYAEGNLLFKEIRNKGYLDNLKELRDEVVSQRLTLENLQDFNSKDVSKIAQEIWECTGIEPLIQSNGLFELYNITESRKNYILSNLLQKDFVEYAQATPTRYNYTMGALPTRQYKITGKITLK